MLTKFRPRIRSRHDTHEPLRGSLPFFPFKSVVRLGSTTDMRDTVTNGGDRLEVNTIEAIKNSSSKLRMKSCFVNAGVITPEFWTKESLLSKSYEEIVNLPYPLIAKRIFGSRGRGIMMVPDKNILSESLLNGDYMYEKYYNYTREYRLHVTEDGCFYACRKMLKQDAPDSERFYRNDNNCVWFMEGNEQFDKPVNWDLIVDECVKAMKSVGLDVGACDVRVQGSTKSNGNLRENPGFMIIEINSAPSFGEFTLQKYREILPQILSEKYKKLVLSNFNIDQI